VTSSLLISVVRKTREIGLLGALGGEPRQVAACFCAQGLFIGVFGTLIGLGLGFVALYFRNDVVLGLARMTQRQEVLPAVLQLQPIALACGVGRHHPDRRADHRHLDAGRPAAGVARGAAQTRGGSPQRMIRCGTLNFER